MVNRLLPVQMKEEWRVYGRLGETFLERESQRFRAPGSILQFERFDASAPSPAPEALFVLQHQRWRGSWNLPSASLP